MKKVFLTISLAILSMVSVSAQTYDTIDSRYEKCYYTRWYDTCRCYLGGQNGKYGRATNQFTNPAELIAFPNQTDAPIQLKGGLVMEIIDTYESLLIRFDNLGFPRVPEYVFLYHYDEKTNTMETLDSARWDTVTPKIMKIPLSAVYDTFVYCYAYEAYFDSPVTVDSVFYLGLTHHNNQEAVIGSFLFRSRPVYYAKVGIKPCNGCRGFDMMASGGSLGSWMTDGQRYHDQPAYYEGLYFGGVLPLVDMSNLDVLSANEEEGTVVGGGRYAQQTSHEITAVPNPGYHFLRWNDSVTDASRIVNLTQDTLFTAYFLGNDIHQVVVASANDSLGTVTGDGYYHEGEEVTITAIPSDSCYFVMWTDSVTDNPRQFTITQDTAFTAVFDRMQFVGLDVVQPRLFAIHPNPATDKVVVDIPEQIFAFGGTMNLVVADAQGRTVLQQTLTAASTTLTTENLPAGLYYVTLHTDGGSSTQKLVVR